MFQSAKHVSKTVNLMGFIVIDVDKDLWSQINMF